MALQSAIIMYIAMLPIEAVRRQRMFPRITIREEEKRMTLTLTEANALLAIPNKEMLPPSSSWLDSKGRG